MTQSGIVRVFSDDTAKSMIDRFLVGKSTRIQRYLSVQKWEYTEEPFWAIVVELFGVQFTGIYGFHVHVNGEVQLIGKQPKSRRSSDDDSGC